MAYVNQDIQANPAAPISAGGAGVASTTKANKPGQNVPAQPSAQLSAYLQANQPQSEQFAGNVASTLSSNVQNAANAIQPAVNTYTSNIYNVPTDTALNQKVATAPSSLTADEQAAYQKELGAASQTPNSANTFETTKPYQDLTANIQQNVEQANLWNAGNNTANISAALNPFEAANATTGDITLDSLLLSQIPTAYSQIQNAVAPAANLQGQLDTGTTQANQALQTAIANDTAATPAAQGSGQQYVTGLNKTLADSLASAQNQANAYNAGVNNLSSNYANLLPLIRNLEASNNFAYPKAYWQPTTQPPISWTAPALGTLPTTITQPTIAQMGTQQQYSDVAALQNLLGTEGYNNLASLITPDTAGQAGTFNAPTAQTIQQYLQPTMDAQAAAYQKLLTAEKQLDPLGASNASMQSDSPLYQLQQALSKLS